ncbi:DUF4124 domain-containing protein [Marinobacter caseinilyticus]|uniref:DUF4124 domain-containing protein n=1 Tax=Marinobacter caseinilyticus TaxID=2692195 RepID=UPI0014097D4C|nr:DUF4124 domain-containing protein [Marinobacter caseinilyticus]
MNRSLVISLFVATVAIHSTSAHAARMYRYNDANGQMVISNTVPQDASTRGYDILNDSGRVIETVPPAPTAEELAERAAAEQRQREAERQREADQKLLRRFSHPDDAVRAMHRKLQQLRGLSQLKRGNISSIVSQLDDEQAKAANMERSGQEVPAAVLKKIDRLQSQIRDIEQEITVQNAETMAVRKQFEQDIQRLEQVTDKERTLPLTPPETAQDGNG